MTKEPSSGRIETRNRGRLILALTCVVVGLALFLVIVCQREPEYQGKTLSFWLRTFGSATASLPPNPAEARRASEAVQHIGTNALPFLLRWISYNPPAWRWQLYNRIVKFDPRLSSFLSAMLGNRDPDPFLALQGFEILGEQTSTAVPDLTRLMNDPRSSSLTSSLAIQALGHAGRPALSPLLAALGNPCLSNRAIVVSTISCLGTNAEPAVPKLVECLNDKDILVGTAAADGLGILALKPELTVPALAGIVEKTNSRLRIQSALALGKFGNQARPAVPSLASGLNDPDPVVRAVALNMLREIDPKAWEKSESP